MHCSRAILRSEDPIVLDLIPDWLVPLGWSCDRIDAEFNPLPLAEAAAFLLLDTRVATVEGRNWVTAVRNLPPPGSSLPILLIADPGAPDVLGCSGRIDLPLHRESALARIAQWTGPLDDHGFRDLHSPRYRLVRLAGQTVADRLMLSFAGQLDAALGQLDQGQDMGKIAHQIAGMAGAMGYAELSRTWAMIERGESADMATARAETMAVSKTVRRLAAPD